jgi:hypothetical protein
VGEHKSLGTDIGSELSELALPSGIIRNTWLGFSRAVSPDSVA